MRHGGPVASNKRRAGHQEVGVRKPQAGDSRARGVALAPARAPGGAGGAASCCAGRAGRGVDRPPGRGCRRRAAFADLRARSRRGPEGGPLRSSCASTRRAGDRVSAHAWAPSAPGFRRSQLRAQAPGFGLPVLVTRAGLLPRWLEGIVTYGDCGKRRHRCSLGPLLQRRGNRAGRVSVLVLALWAL